MTPGSMRSKLFVPGSRPELFAKALASAADAISIDLEDAVVEARKSEARARAIEFLQSAAARNSGKVFVVRVNARGTAQFEADLLACVQAGVTLVNLPKCESAEDVRAAALVLDEAEESRGAGQAARLLVNVETPRGLRLAAELAAADPRVMGLQIGYLDLLGPLGIERPETAAIHSILFSVRLAAGEVGVEAYDGAFPDVRDAAGYRAEAEMARRLGYAGKSCIHPSQIALANEIFRPSEAEVAQARRVVDAAQEARARGDGAFALDGRMIDAPAVRRAEALLALNHRIDSGSTRGTP